MSTPDGNAMATKRRLGLMLSWLRKLGLLLGWLLIIFAVIGFLTVITDGEVDKVVVSIFSGMIGSVGVSLAYYFRTKGVLIAFLRRTSEAYTTTNLRANVLFIALLGVGASAGLIVAFENRNAIIEATGPRVLVLVFLFGSVALYFLKSWYRLEYGMILGLSGLYVGLNTILPVPINL